MGVTVIVFRGISKRSSGRSTVAGPRRKPAASVSRGSPALSVRSEACLTSPFLEALSNYSSPSALSWEPLFFVFFPSRHRRDMQGLSQGLPCNARAKRALSWELADLFCKGPARSYFPLCRPYGLCFSSSTKQPRVCKRVGAAIFQ